MMAVGQDLTGQPPGQVEILVVLNTAAGRRVGRHESRHPAIAENRVAALGAGEVDVDRFAVKTAAQCGRLAPFLADRHERGWMGGDVRRAAATQLDVAPLSLLLLRRRLD